jgi:hypothetical protein
VWRVCVPERDFDGDGFVAVIVNVIVSSDVSVLDALQTKEPDPVVVPV